MQKRQCCVLGQQLYPTTQLSCLHGELCQNLPHPPPSLPVLGAVLKVVYFRNHSSCRSLVCSTGHCIQGLRNPYVTDTLCKLYLGQENSVWIKEWMEYIGLDWGRVACCDCWWPTQQFPEQPVPCCLCCTSRVASSLCCAAQTPWSQDNLSQTTVSDATGSSLWYQQLHCLLSLAFMEKYSEKLSCKSPL